VRRVSLNARTALLSATTAEVEVALFIIEHATLDAPIRLSTDPTERLSVEPLAYGTRSTWGGSNPATEPFQFILAATELPGDIEDAPASAVIVLENVDMRIAEQLRSFTDRPVVHMAVVYASSPNLVEVEYRDLRMISADGDAGEVRIGLSRAPIEDETVPMDRFTKDRFPGLFL
jgi:hypothetical protein